MREHVSDVRDLILRYRTPLLVAYAASAWWFVLVRWLVPRHSAAVFLALAWPLWPAALAGLGIRVDETSELAIVGTILVNGGVYAALWVAGTHAIRRRRQRRQSTGSAT